MSNLTLVDIIRRKNAAYDIWAANVKVNQNQSDSFSLNHHWRIYRSWVQVIEAINKGVDPVIAILNRKID